MVEHSPEFMRLWIQPQMLKRKEWPRSLLHFLLPSPLCPFSPRSPPASLHMLMAGLYSSPTPLLLYPTTLLTPLPMPLLNPILYYTVLVCPVAGLSGMLQHGPSEAPPSPTPGYTSTRDIPSPSLSFIKHNKKYRSPQCLLESKPVELASIVSGVGSLGTLYH